MISLDVEPGVSGYMNLTAGQRNTIQVAERVGASLSLVGVVFVIITYALFKKVRSVSNTFIFYASVANVGASIACLIGYDGIDKGDTHPLCQAQAFLLEMFMQSDPWWSLSMAVNVFMVFFLHYNADTLMKYMWIYNVVSFGMPALPAIICLFIKPKGTPIYGNATLWCWISDDYNQLRIFTYYLPIWVCIFITTLIYLAIGYHVFHGRNQLRDLTMSTQVHEFTTTSEVRDSAEKSLAGGQTGTTTTATYGMVTTEVQVTTSAECSESTTRPPTPVVHSSVTANTAPQILPAGQTHHHHGSAGSGSGSGQASVIHPWTSSTCSNDDTLTIASPASPTSPGVPFTTISSISSTIRPLAPTLKPTSSQAAPNSNNTRQQKATTPRYLEPILRPVRKLKRMLNGLDPIKLAYLRTSFIFAVSVLVTWTPSSINRVYTLIYPTKTNFGLNLASAIVLPLQGVWNVVIYVLTTWEGLNEEIYRSLGWAPGAKWRQRRRAAIAKGGNDNSNGLHGLNGISSGGNKFSGNGNGNGYIGMNNGQGIRPGIGGIHGAGGGIDDIDYHRHHHHHPHSQYRHHHDLSSSTAGDLDIQLMNDDGNIGSDANRLSVGPIGIGNGISRRDHHHEMDFDDDDELPINRTGSSNAYPYQPPPSPRYQGHLHQHVDGLSLSSAGGGSANDRTSWKKKGTVRILRNGSL